MERPGAHEGEGPSPTVVGLSGALGLPWGLKILSQQKREKLKGPSGQVVLTDIFGRIIKHVIGHVLAPFRTLTQKQCQHQNPLERS